MVSIWTLGPFDLGPDIRFFLYWPTDVDHDGDCEDDDDRSSIRQEGVGGSGEVLDLGT